MQTHLAVLLISALVDGSRGDSFHEMSIDAIDVKTEPGPYFGAWSVEPVGTDAVIIKMPITADLPPEMMMGLEMKLGEFNVPKVEETLCSAFVDQLIDTESGVPKGQFPQGCPVKANNDYAVMNYKLPSDKVPPGTEGPYSILMTLFMPGEPPVVTLTAEGKIGHKMPSVPKIG